MSPHIHRRRSKSPRSVLLPLPRAFNHITRRPGPPIILLAPEEILENHTATNGNTVARRFLSDLVITYIIIYKRSEYVSALSSNHHLLLKTFNSCIKKIGLTNISWNISILAYACTKKIISLRKLSVTFFEHLYRPRIIAISSSCGITVFTQVQRE